MFIRNATSIAKNTGAIYLRVSTAGAAIGGMAGGTLGLMSFPVACLAGSSCSDKKSASGAFLDGVNEGVKYFAKCTLFGTSIGGLPITYPVAKAISKYNERKSSSLKFR